MHMASLVLLILSAAALPAGEAAAVRQARIIFLHHSTGGMVWKGGVPEWIAAYNAKNGTDYRIGEQAFPKKAPYGWQNYPFDYWNIWVKNAGEQPFSEEPTLEMLSKQYDMIIFKHCYPGAAIQADAASPDIASRTKTLANYRLQYTALREKMRSFPGVKFLVWTPAALIESATNEASAKRAVEFANWMRATWDEPNDNIFVWDFMTLETDGGLYLKAENANPKDSHPNKEFCRRVAPLFAQRIVDVIEGRGDAKR